MFKRTPSHQSLLVLLLLFALTSVGCAGQVTVAAVSDAIGGPDSVTGRHDAYVQADESLSDIQRAAYLADSATVVSAIEGAVAAEEKMVDAGPLVQPVDGVVDRHNAYIALDEGLSQTAKEIFINEAVLLQRVFQEADRQSGFTSAIGADSPLSE